MDATEKLVSQSATSAAVLGSGDDFLLVPLEGGTLPVASVEIAKARGYFYCGVLCVVNGHVEIEGPQEFRPILLRAAVPFAEYVVAKKRAGDAVDWLEKLHSLPDSRADKFCLDTDEPQATERSQC
jgi:hypothetical protein